MDTIAAIATGGARSAIGVIRVSGDAAFGVIDRVFAPENGKPLSAHPPRRMVYGAVRDAAGRVIDRALAVRFDAAHSYTGEDGAELHCHGSPVVLGEALLALFAAGARQAKAGEFTRRAFLNGRLDLTEAEAVVDLVDAESAEAARNAAAQADGALRRLAEDAYSRLLDVESRFYAVVDYPDEDIADASPAETAAALTETETALADLLATYARGRVMKNGVAAAIVGAPNAGKSSLLNRLVGFDRAIVTDIAGTTRDTVEEKAVVGGVLLRLIDTAGLRRTDDAVERLGVERARRAVESADLVLALVDSSRDPTWEDLETLAVAGGSGKPWLLLSTKRDLMPGQTPPILAHVGRREGGRAPERLLSLSNLTGEGFDALEAAVAALYPAPPPSGGTLLTNARQADAVSRALDAVRAALGALRGGMTPDVVLTEAEAASAALGELTGRTAREDMVARIFERFCVGK